MAGGTGLAGTAHRVHHSNNIITKKCEGVFLPSHFFHIHVYVHVGRLFNKLYVQYTHVHLGYQIVLEKNVKAFFCLHIFSHPCIRSRRSVIQ